MTEQGGGSDSADAVLRRELEPALREAATALDAVSASGAALGGADRDRLSTLLADAAERTQRELGVRALDPRVHRIVGAAAASAMALTLGADAVPAGQVRDRLAAGLDEIAAGS
jgi:hypothetical protein